MSVSPLIKFGILLGVIWMVQDVNAPRRRYREKHVDPIEREIADLRTELASLREEEQEAIWTAELFSRNLNAEEADLRRRRKEAYNEVEPLNDRFKALVARRRQVKTWLDDWFGEAEGGFVGNAGQKLRTSSFWGSVGIEQTLDQRDDLKAEKVALGNELDVLRPRIDEIYRDQIDPAKEGLKEIKRARARLREIQKERQTAAPFKRRATILRTRIAELEDEIAELQAQIRKLELAF